MTMKLNQKKKSGNLQKKVKDRKDYSSQSTATTETTTTTKKTPIFHLFKKTKNAKKPKERRLLPACLPAYVFLLDKHLQEGE